MAGRGYVVPWRALSVPVVEREGSVTRKADMLSEDGMIREPQSRVREACLDERMRNTTQGARDSLLVWNSES